MPKATTGLIFMQLSLYGTEEFASWTGVNGSQFEANLTLNSAYVSSYIPSKSFGLHVGSVTANIGGSLILGGYDSSRCLTEPITSDTSLFKLLEISLNVTRGASAFLNTEKSTISGLLQTSGDQAIGLQVQPEPGVPYLYLPRETCDVIASHLPVTYSEEFNLYLWDVDAPAYSEIISSPHSLVFSFASGTDGREMSNINVPFALLNLTLSTPLKSKPTPYFPCSPWNSSEDTSYHLGRAFLQAAFLSQNSHSNTMFLAQAPGPDHLAQNVKKIATTDSGVTPASNAPDWDSTWAGTLKALSSSSSDTGSGTTNATGTGPGTSSGNDDGQDTTMSQSSGISTKAIGGSALALWYLVLRKRQRQQQSQQSSLLQPPHELPPSPPSYASPAAWAAKDDDEPPVTPELVGTLSGGVHQQQQQYHHQQLYADYSSSSDKDGSAVAVNELHAKSRPSELPSSNSLNPTSPNPNPRAAAAAAVELA